MKMSFGVDRVETQDLSDQHSAGDQADQTGAADQWQVAFAFARIEDVVGVGPEMNLN